MSLDHFFFHRLEEASSQIYAQNNTASNYLISHAQNTTAFQPIVFLHGIHPFLVTNQERPATPTGSIGTMLGRPLLTRYLYQVS
jgi:hypothetical protein